MMPCLATAHALVLLDDHTIVRDLMGKTMLEALDWVMSKVRRAHSCGCAVLGMRCWLTHVDGRGPGPAGEDDGAAPHAAARAAPVPVLIGAEAHVSSGERAACDRIITLPQRTPHAPPHARASRAPLNCERHWSCSVACAHLAALDMHFTSDLDETQSADVE